MSWAAILALGGGAYAFKALGLVVLDHTRLPPAFSTVSGLLPPALLAALIVVQTFSDGTDLTVDARAAGLVAGSVAVALRAPFVIVVLSAAGVTAGLRALA